MAVEASAALLMELGGKSDLTGFETASLLAGPEVFDISIGFKGVAFLNGLCSLHWLADTEAMVFFVGLLGTAAFLTGLAGIGLLGGALPNGPATD